jgi:hypothetical protein
VSVCERERERERDREREREFNMRAKIFECESVIDSERFSFKNTIRERESSLTIQI